MTDITWNISKLECKTSEGNYTDVVITANWECIGVDGEYKAYVYGSCGFPAPSSSFTPFQDLTMDQVINWCWDNGVNKDETEAAVQFDIDYKKNPPIVSPPLPWAEPTEEQA